MNDDDGRKELKQAFTSNRQCIEYARCVSVLYCQTSPFTIMEEDGHHGNVFTEDRDDFESAESEPDADNEQDKEKVSNAPIFLEATRFSVVVCA